MQFLLGWGSGFGGTSHVDDRNAWSLADGREGRFGNRFAALAPVYQDDHGKKLEVDHVKPIIV